MAVDPVCGMDVEPGKAASTTTHEGEQYYFCAEACRQQFEREPARYLKAPGGDWAPLAKKEGFFKRLLSSG